MTGRLVRLLAALTLVLIGLGAAPAVIGAEPSVTVTDQQAESQFPAGIRFTMAANASEDVVALDLVYHLADDETLSMINPEFDPGTDVNVEYFLDLQTSFAPAGIDLTWNWRFHFADGSSEDGPVVVTTWEDTRFEWERVGTADVEVNYYSGDAGFADQVAQAAQQAVDDLRVLYGAESIVPIRVWIYDSSEDFSETQATNSSEWVAGTAYPAYHVILAILPTGNEREMMRVIPHEISHQVLSQSTRNPFNVPPTWLDEGLAVKIQPVGAESYPAMVEGAAARGDLPSVQSLISSFPYDASAAALSYASSLSIVQFIETTWGPDGLTRLITAYRGGVSHDEALMEALGVDTAGLNAQWQASLGVGP